MTLSNWPCSFSAQIPDVPRWALLDLALSSGTDRLFAAAHALGKCFTFHTDLQLHWLPASLPALLLPSNGKDLGFNEMQWQILRWYNIATDDPPVIDAVPRFAGFSMFLYQIWWFQLLGEIASVSPRWKERNSQNRTVNSHNFTACARDDSTPRLSGGTGSNEGSSIQGGRDRCMKCIFYFPSLRWAIKSWVLIHWFIQYWLT